MINQEVASELLQSEGSLVEIANNGEEAIEKVRCNHFDLVLMDVQMPILDGLEATRQIRQTLSRELPIIAMTASVVLGDINKYKEAGMNDYVYKPVDVDNLFETIQKWLPKRDHHHVHDQSFIANEYQSDLQIPAIAGLDIEKGMKHVAGNKQLYIKLLDEFVQLSQNESEQLKTFMLQERFEDVRERIHTLKGVAGNLGASDLYECLSRFEKALKQLDRVQEVTLAAKQSLKAIDDLRGTIEKVRDRHPEFMKFQDQKAAAKHSKEIMEDVLTKILEMILQCDAATFAYVKEHENVLLENGYAEQNRVLQDVLGKYDFDGAKEVMIRAFKELF